jgi:hypothetical protein
MGAIKALARTHSSQIACLAREFSTHAVTELNILDAIWSDGASVSHQRTFGRMTRSYMANRVSCLCGAPPGQESSEKIRWEEGEFTKVHGRYWCGTLESWQTQAYGKRMTVRPCRRAWQHTHGHAVAPTQHRAHQHPPMAIHALAPTKVLKVRRTHA